MSRVERGRGKRTSQEHRRRDQQQRRRAHLQANQEIPRPSWPRVPVTTSPRIVRIGSMRVACSAGTSPNNIVETPAPTMRNSATRQSASGTNDRKSPISGGQLVVTALMITSSATREIAKPAAAATSASSRLSVNSWRTMRRRVAPSDSRMPISRCRDYGPGEEKVGDVGTGDQQDEAERKEQRRGHEHRFARLLDGTALRYERDGRQRRATLSLAKGRSDCGSTGLQPRRRVPPVPSDATGPASGVR